ncbi:MAG: LytR C-terminal domain-containing protein [Acidimicrobiales bacterium]
MSASGGAASRPPADDDARATTIGAVLIAVAVLIGFVLLLKGLDQEGGVVETGSPTRETTTTTVAEALEQTTTTTAAPRPPAEVNVLVANASGGSGVAGANKAKLTAAGYTTVETANAPPQSTSAVYFVSGWQLEAEAVARALGIGASSVSPMPASPPVALNGATVLVIIGSDKA